MRPLAGHRVFTLVRRASGPEVDVPLLVLHGFPTSSYDFHLVADALCARRTVAFVDMLGYGLSSKPDQPYRLAEQADIAAAFVAELGISRLALLTHDMGDTVGGELLARQLEGAWPVEVTARVVTNGSIYIEMAQLSVGQEVLLSLPDARLEGEVSADGTAMKAGLQATFSPHSAVPAGELDAMWELISRNDGQRVLTRTIRYIEERRANQDRYTGAIERHPSPLAILWGTDDPIALVAMATRLAAARPDAAVTLLDGVGHYPMVEAPARFAEAVTAFLG